MTDDQIKAFVTHFETAMNTGRPEAADSLFAPGFTDHDPWPGHPADGAGFKAGLAEMRSSFPDLNVKVEQVIAQGDHIAVRFRISGTQLGAFMGAPPSGNTFSVAAIDIHRISDGRIAEHWGVIDAAAMMSQLADAIQSP
jgi:steroid delta-isomerase-like uncharacterized protein